MNMNANDVKMMVNLTNQGDEVSMFAFNKIIDLMQEIETLNASHTQHSRISGNMLSDIIREKDSLNDRLTDISDENEDLREANENLLDERDMYWQSCDDMEETILDLTAQLDEARREICKLLAADENGITNLDNAMIIAKDRGWSCFRSI